jgi:transcription factor 1
MDRIAQIEDTRKPAKTDALTAIYALNLDNKHNWWRQHVADVQLEADEASRTLARVAADPSKTSEELDRADKRCAGMREKIAKMVAKIHYRVLRGHDRTLDDTRIFADTGTFDDSVFLFDRRPFEPLRIDPEEQYPRIPRTLVYFEADANPPVAQKLSLLSNEKRRELMELFETLSSISSTRVQLTLSELYEVILPERTTNEIVKALPILARYAMKRLKPGCGPVALEDPTLDPNDCFQENIDYDLSDARIRRLPASVIWDILIDYQNSAPDVSPRQFNRLLGGTVTGAASGAGAATKEFKLR